MKNRTFIKSASLFLMPVALVLSAVSFAPKSAAKVNAEDGYEYGGLTTTIDLNDVEDEDIINYYSGLQGKSTSQLQGENLLINLKKIISNGQKYYKYDGGSLWKLYEITDRDWVKSPASEISGYNVSTNTITGYRYGNENDDPYIHALYVDRNVDNQTRAMADHQQTQWGINQEHIWPKSQGFNASGDLGARGDPMHLWAGNGRVNGTEHNNYMYGFVDEDKISSCPYVPGSDKLNYANLKDNFRGTSVNLEVKQEVFEPQDCDKGDIARAIFYMVARYNHLGDNEEITSNNPDLELAQIGKAAASYTSSSSRKGQMGIMTDLLEWNRLDPVDEYEIHRNNLLYRNYTKNRNPFIDYPQWADYIWGTVQYDGKVLEVYDSKPAGHVDFTEDVINGFKSDIVSPLVSIEITKPADKTSFTVGDTFTSAGLEVTATFENGTQKLVKADVVAPDMSSIGTKNVDLSVTVGGVTKNASYQITVHENRLDHITLSGNYKTSFEQYGDFNSDGLVVTAHYTDPVESVAVTDFTVSQPSLSEVGSETITVSYTEGIKEVTDSYTINVTESTKPITYELYSNEVVGKGKYMIAYTDSKGNSTAIANNTKGPRLDYKEVSIVNDTITNVDQDLVWDIEKTDSYYTIYNAQSETYIASNGVRNNATLTTDAEDSKALWTISLSETSSGKAAYDVISKYNAESNINAYLQKNGDYGYATYAKGAYGALRLYKLHDDGYKKATAVTDIEAGDSFVLLGSSSEGVAYATSTRKYSNNTLFEGIPCDITTNDTYIESNEEFAVLTVVDYNGNTLLMYESKYIAMKSTGPGMNFVDDSSAASIFTISFTTKWEICTVLNGTNYYLRLNYSGSTTARFGFYTANTYTLMLYQPTVIGDADTWCASFLDGTENGNQDNWEDLAASYALLRKGSRTLIENAEATGTNIESRAAARYDCFMGRGYDLTPFMEGRASNASNKNVTFGFNGDKNTIIVIASVGFIGTISIIGYVLIKRRKEVL